MPLPGGGGMPPNEEPLPGGGGMPPPGGGGIPLPGLQRVVVWVTFGTARGMRAVRAGRQGEQ